MRRESRSTIKRRRLKWLWNAQGGMCFWCLCDTVLLRRGKQNDRTPHAATIDHKLSRYEGRETHKDSLGDVVMACRTCNEARGQAAAQARPWFHLGHRPLKCRVGYLLLEALDDS